MVRLMVVVYMEYGTWNMEYKCMIVLFVYSFFSDDESAVHNNKVFPLEEIQDPQPGSAIITFTNRAVNIISAKIFEKLNTPEVVCRSTDTIYNDNVEFPHFAQEGLNKLEMKGLPQEILPLEVNTIVMLLRNLNTEQGLCNGTRLKILDLEASKIEASIMGGDQDQEVAIIPKNDSAIR
ncbi:unnamed protein product [Ambrosiozyma monospora]|uniref:Unnamed protein product n=1 Tax=Ambrosiozyma monospora TaxID=43982 RepID=A0A9W6YYY7_AMBMO|nr:unnamed protein product [Ambrosiozyma monospora]